MKKSFSVVLFFMIVIYCSCSKKITITTPDPAPYPSPPVQLVAGIAQTDLTPPPGYPMSGYSLDGKISHGYWVRPKATALYLRDKTGAPFVFVTTDLWAITDGQKMHVLELLGKDPSTRFIGESELLLAAIHSHHSIGVNVPDDAFSATSIGFGFDKESFEFTARQIAAAVTMAIHSAQPANVTFSADTVRGIAKNRSVNSYLRNNPAERDNYFQGTVGEHRRDVSVQEIESMIDERLTLITVRSMDNKIKGILASYPMHPTATGAATEVYSADVFGLASASASHDLPDHPIIAFYNGAEGDVAPVYDFHNRSDAIRIAGSLSQSIARTALANNGISLSGAISHRTRIIDIASNKVEYDSLDKNCYCRLPEATVSTAGKALVGASVFAGASDGRTSLSSLGFNDGIKSDACDPEQGYKMPAVKFLVTDVLGQVIHEPMRSIAMALIKTKPTTNLHISIHKVGPVCFVGLPGEFTTMLGRRVKHAVAKQFNADERTVSLVGLADAYVSYVTTPCEYNEQAYEGASDYFGISTGQAFVKEYERLAGKDADKMEERKGRKTRYKIGGFVTFGPSHLLELQTWNSEEGLQNLLVSDNGQKLHSHFIPSDVQSQDTILITANEAAAYSFEDTVTTITNNGNFYPVITLVTGTQDTLYIPEYILTLDKYSEDHSTWTVRIPDISFLGDTIAKFTVTSLSGVNAHPEYSAFFKRK